mmetsp:Transcript_1070/g.2950  ORF Transcript_1070/g.2950 Transcript_1070/m.2950 type:complete len:176 (-) Transcript_1070:25-552(-)
MPLADDGNFTDETASVTSTEEGSLKDEDTRIIVWKTWERRFRRTTEDLLLNCVDPDVEKHMSLEPILTSRTRRQKKQALFLASPLSPEYWFAMEKDGQDTSPVEQEEENPTLPLREVGQGQMERRQGGKFSTGAMRTSSDRLFGRKHLEKLHLEHDSTAAAYWLRLYQHDLTAIH